MELTIDNPLQRHLNISVPSQQVENEVSNRLQRLARTVKMHGFRPGKVPVKMVEQQYGPSVRKEVLEDALKRSFREAVRDQNLRIAGVPRFDANPLPADGQSYEYSVTFEVYPEVTLGDVSGKTISRPVVQVSEADVDKTITTLRKQRATFEPADRAAQTGDRITLDFNGTIGGTAFEGGQASDFSTVLGDSGLLKDFEKQLDGMKAGESKTFDMRFPDDYNGREVAGKTATFVVTVKQVAAPKLPEVDAEFAKAFGIANGDVAKMRADVRSNLEREVKRRIDARLKEQVMEALIESTPITLPQSLVDLEKQRLAQAMREDLAARGVGGADISLPDDLLDSQARRRVSLGLIMAELVKANDLHAKPEQVRAVVEDFAQSYEHPDEVVRWYYQSPERLGDAESLALESNVVEWMLSRCKVEDKPTAFDELMGNV
ncbi:MAG: trigger factor [Pseudomonadota bacterium]